MMEHRGRRDIVKLGDLFLAQLGYLSAFLGEHSAYFAQRATKLSKSSQWASKSWPIYAMTNVRRRAMMQIEPSGPAGR
jgi:hypothetical protein